MNTVNQRNLYQNRNFLTHCAEAMLGKFREKKFGGINILWHCFFKECLFLQAVSLRYKDSVEIGSCGGLVDTDSVPSSRSPVPGSNLGPGGPHQREI